MATAEVTIISSSHGRQRRVERGIAKIDLQVAVKYGVRTRTQSGVWGGRHYPRWKYVQE
jgi:hypothetical protein